MDDRFKHHSPSSEDVVARHQAVRSAADDFFSLIQQACPDSHEKSLAVIKVEEAMMWANAAIARNQ